MKISTIVDTNVLMDVWGRPGSGTSWSKSALIRCLGDGPLIINQIVWSELAPLAPSEQTLLDAAAELDIESVDLPWRAAFLAGVCHSAYRRNGGTRERTLPDFLIGAHASVGEHRLLTRDPTRYRSYFPSLDIMAPDTHPLRDYS